MKRPRDFQRAKYYEAERDCWDCGPGGEFDNFGSVGNTQAACNEISCGVLFERLFGFNIRFTIKDGRGRDSGCYLLHPFDGHIIKLPRFSRFKLYLLHEIAHGVVRMLYGVDVASHGAEFAGITILLVHEFMSPKAAAKLEKSLEESGVNITL